MIEQLIETQSLKLDKMKVRNQETFNGFFTQCEAEFNKNNVDLVAEYNARNPGNKTESFQMAWNLYA